MKIGEKYNLGDGKIVEITGFSEGMKMKHMVNGEMADKPNPMIDWVDTEGKTGKFAESVFAKASTDLDPTITSCAYCRALNKKEDTIQATIISPNWKSTGYRSPLRNYCKGKPCAGHDQMAHEG